MTASSDSDLVLLRRYADLQDADSFLEITNRHAAMVFAVARRVTGNSHDAEDVSQACFLELCAVPKTFVLAWGDGCTGLPSAVLKMSGVMQLFASVTSADSNMRRRFRPKPNGTKSLPSCIMPWVDCRTI